MNEHEFVYTSLGDEYFAQARCRCVRCHLEATSPLVDGSNAVEEARIAARSRFLRVVGEECSPAAKKAALARSKAAE